MKKAIVDILKENNLYTFMAIKEMLLQHIKAIMDKTEYASKYALSGSFFTSDQTISIVVGVMTDKDAMIFIGSGSGVEGYGSSPALKDYTYGVNITGINDDEVKNIARTLFYELIERIPSINRESGARIHSDPYMQPAHTMVTGDKRYWISNIYFTVGIGETYYPNLKYVRVPNDNNPKSGIGQSLYDKDIITDIDIRELFVPYLRGLIEDTEYGGVMTIIDQNASSNINSDTSIALSLINEQDEINPYNGALGSSFNLDKYYYQHDRNVDVVLEVTMPDNDALWMFVKYLYMCIRRDTPALTGTGKIKIAKLPTHGGITPQDLGARKIWLSKLTIPVRIHNVTTKSVEIG